MSMQATATPSAPQGQMMPGGSPVPRVMAWRVVGGIMSVLLIAAGALSMAGQLARRTQTQDATYPGTLSRLVVDVGSGDVQVSAGADDQVRLHRHLTWTFHKPQLRESRDGDTLRLRYDCPLISFGPECSIDYRLVVPAGVRLEVYTGSGDITLSGLRGQVAARAASGGVSVRDSSGDLTLRSASGDISGTGLRSRRVASETASGDISLSFAGRPDSVQARVASGDVTVAVPEVGLYRVSTSTASGDSHVGVARSDAASASITVESASGDVTVVYSR